MEEHNGQWRLAPKIETCEDLNFCTCNAQHHTSVEHHNKHAHPPRVWSTRASGEFSRGVVNQVRIVSHEFSLALTFDTQGLEISSFLDMKLKLKLKNGNEVEYQ